jgi:hypothetical protein
MLHIVFFHSLPKLLSFLIRYTKPETLLGKEKGTAYHIN